MTTAAKVYKYTRPPLYPKQELAIFAPQRMVFIEASSKSGKTVGCIAWILEQAMFSQPGRNFWWVAPVYAQAKIAFRRIKGGLTAGTFRTNEAEMTITLASGAVISFKGGDNPDSLYGEDVYACVVDEASRCKDDVWTAIRSTLTATRGPIRVIGNVKGRKNWFYRLARIAESGDDPEMLYAKITAWDAVEGGVLDQEEIDSARRQLPEQVFRELYLAEPSDDAGNPFGLDHIGNCIRPLSDAPPVCFGLDLAKSTDWCVLIGLDINRTVCAYQRWQGPWELTEKKIVAAVGDVPTLVDSTGVGDRVLEGLQKIEGTNFRGFKFSMQSKQQIIEGLAVDIQQKRIGFPSSELLKGCQIVPELEAFEYEYRPSGTVYSAPEGLHDDAVYALALARDIHAHRPRPLSLVAPEGSERISPFLDGPFLARFDG